MNPPAVDRPADPAAAPLRALPMTPDEFEAWRVAEIPRHARAQVEAGVWTEAESLDQAQASHRQLLPQGLATPGHHFFRLVVADRGEDGATRDRPVGMLWYADQVEAGRPGAYVYDLEIDDAAQGRGLGAQALAWLEDRMRASGGAFLRLNVFAHNARARRLYERTGFAETHVWMRKML